MGISVIRKYDADDKSAVEKSALRFAKRHDYVLEAEGDVLSQLEAELHFSDDQRIRRLWQMILCRALGMTYDARITIAYGHIGYSV